MANKVVLSTEQRGITKLIYMSFFIAFLALGGSTLITVLASLGDFNDPAQKLVRSALISETCVNIIAGFTYFYLLKYLYEEKVPLSEITSIRYMDWILTTPFLLLSFAFYATYNKYKGTPDETSMDYVPLSYLIILNFAMLFFGFMGETGRMDKLAAFGFGFFAFALLFWLLYDRYVKDVKDKESLEIVYYLLTAVWFFYGVSYYLPVVSKNVGYNILDMVSKSLFGVFLWISAIEFNT
jgi:bacteriorhodopsin